MSTAKGTIVALTLLLVVPTASASEVVRNTDPVGDGSLREAIDDADDGEAVVFASDVRGTIELDEALEIDKPLTIKGPGADLLTIRSSGESVFVITDTASISGVTIAGGEATIRMEKGKLTLLDCAARNSAGNGIEAERGKIVVYRTLVAGNHGAGIASGQADVACVGSTIADNGGAGIRTEEGAVTSDNCTLLDNRGAGLETAGGQVSAHNTIIVRNLTACVGSVLSRGHNLVDDGSCGFAQPGDVQSEDPRVAALAHNGGPTETAALTGGSPAIDGGDPEGCVDPVSKGLLIVDQRGMRRPSGARCDIGAFEQPVAVTGTTVNRILALVDGEPITQHQLEQFAATDPRIAQARGISQAQLLDVLITDRLVDKEADAQGITASDSEVDRYIADIRRQNRISEAQLRDALAQQGLTLERYRQQIGDEIKRAQLINREIRGKISISPEEIERHYKAEGKQPDAETDGDQAEVAAPDEVSVSQIMLTIPKDASPEEIDAIKAKADALHDELEGGADFAEVAKRESQDGAAASGGKLGTLKVGDLRPELAEALAELEPGEYSNPIQTGSGVHIIRLDERTGAREAKASDSEREEIKEKLYAKALEERYARWLKEDLRSRHVVEILP
jgi:peptidyl-prolyl cis-trans isomerase SurA